MIEWHIWSIKQHKYIKVKEFLEGIDNIIDFLYPVVEQEYKTKKGKRKRDIPVYSNYIFIKYDSTPELMAEINDCKWISRYIGKCSKEEINDVFKINGKNYEDVMPNKYGLSVGMKVSLKNNGLIVTIQEMQSNNLVVSLDIFGKTNIFKCDVDDVIMDM
jgi:transcription antitermination factor NusG